MKVAPAQTRATRWGALTARQRSWAASMSLNAIASPAACDPGRLVTLVRWRKVAKVDSGWSCADAPSPRPGRGPCPRAPPDRRHCLLRRRVRGFLQRGQHVRRLVKPAPAFPGLREHFTQRLPEPERAVADGQDRGAHAAAGAVAQQVRPRLRGLTVALGEGDKLLAAIGARRSSPQAQLVLLEADVHVDPVRPQVEVVHRGQVPGGEGALLRLPCLGLPCLGQPGDHRR